MELKCCMCGEEVWDKLAEAVDNAIEVMEEEVPMPTIGVICDSCMTDLRKDGILK